MDVKASRFTEEQIIRVLRIKLVFWDGTGLCLFAKRLEDGTFRWPKIEDGVMRLSAAQLQPG
jgi:transposase